jgi:hypothetical protein
VAEMRAELGELSKSPRIGWDGVSPETLEEIASADTKRAALPAAMEDGGLAPGGGIVGGG